MAGFAKKIATNTAVEVGMGAGLDIGMQLALACKGLPGNPYEDCVAQCDKLDVDKGKAKTKLDKKILKKERDICIMEQGCNDKDKFGNPIFENKNLKEECQKNLLAQVDTESTQMQLQQDVAVGVAETMALDHLKKQPQSGAAKTAKQAKSGKSVSKIGGRIIGTKVGQTIGKSAIAQGTKTATNNFIKTVLKAGIAMKSSMIKIITIIAGSLKNFAIKQGIKLGVKTTTSGLMIAAKIWVNLFFKEAAMYALKYAAGAIVVVAGALSIVDGAAIILGLWDPGGWEMTIDKGMIQTTRDAYYRSYLKYYDNKALFSEPAVADKKEKEKTYNELLEEYNKNKTTENKKKLDIAEKEYNDAVDLMYKLQWKGSERPKEHGGPLIYPLLAYPTFPHDEDGNWLDPKLEEEYYYQIDQYMKKNNLVWTEEELKQEEYKAEVDELNKKLEENLKKEDPELKKIEEKKSGNVSKKEIKIVEENIKKDEENIKIIDDSIVELTKTMKSQEESGRIDKIPELQEKIDKLKENKKQIEKKKQQKNKLLENIEKNKNNGATVEQKIKQNKAIRKGFGNIFVFLIIVLIGFFVYTKRKNIANSSQFKTMNSYFNPDIASNFKSQLNQQPNYQQPNYQQPNYQQPNYQQPNYQQPNYQQPNYQQNRY